MAAWGAGGFENDDALDFLAEVASAGDLAAELNKRPEDPSQETSADQAQRIVAAAECVAAMLGRPAADLPKDLQPKIAAFGEVRQELLDAAREAVSSVLSWSEPPDRWAEDGPTPFNLSVTSLIDRLNPELPFDLPEAVEEKEVRQTCGFCNGKIEPLELLSISIDRRFDDINHLSRGFWCHLRCLNARLHPRQIIQNWQFDPDEIDRLADEILKQELGAGHTPSPESKPDLVRVLAAESARRAAVGDRVAARGQLGASPSLSRGPSRESASARPCASGCRCRSR